jgi:hypothetical chaperone protein
MECRQQETDRGRLGRFPTLPTAPSISAFLTVHGPVSSPALPERDPVTRPSPDISIGIDFGTTNTVLAVAECGKPVRSITWPHSGEVEDVYRSVLCFERHDTDRVLTVETTGGPYAIERYLGSVSQTRFIQSFKSHIASAVFRDTRIFSTRFLFEDLLSTFFGLVLRDSGDPVPLGAAIVAGRPVAFAGGNPDEALAHRRYEAAFAKAGLARPTYVYEPVGAAYYYAQRLETDATILVGDFGGGTSDFSILRFERRKGALRAIPLGHAGIGIAGDSFDYRIINAVVSPRLGKGSQYHSMGQTMEVPAHYYANFARWHQLALLKSAENRRELDKLMKIALEPKLIAQLIEVIENDWGFAVYRAVSAAKMALSSQPRTLFSFRKGDIVIEQEITTAQFEGWIADDLARIDATVDDLFQREGLTPSAIDRVFLTGGTSYIPAVRRLFAQRFGADKLDSGGQFESIAHGLALIGLEPDRSAWEVAAPPPAR